MKDEADKWLEGQLFSGIDNPDNFNDIIGNPENWKFIDEDIYKNLVLPNAINLFGMKWFNSVKHKSSISNGAIFPLFEGEEERST